MEGVETQTAAGGGWNLPLRQRVPSAGQRIHRQFMQVLKAGFQSLRGWFTQCNVSRLIQVRHAWHGIHSPRRKPGAVRSHRVRNSESGSNIIFGLDGKDGIMLRVAAGEVCPKSS